jgi:hypothetical protein
MDIEAATEDIPRLYRAHITLADRRIRGIEDKAAGQCRGGDLGVCVDSLTILLDLAVADATARSYRQPPPVTSEEPPPHHMVPIQRRGRRRRASRPDNPPLGGERIFLPLPPLAFRDSRLLLSIECTRRSPSSRYSSELREWKTPSALWLSC